MNKKYRQKQKQLIKKIQVEGDTDGKNVQLVKVAKESKVQVEIEIVESKVQVKENS